jgi:hypothetical protein
MDSIIFSFDTKIGNVSIRDRKFFICLLDEYQIDPFLSKSAYQTAKYLLELFENSNTEIIWKFNYNAYSTSKKKEKKITDLLKKDSEISVKYLMEWLILL